MANRKDLLMAGRIGAGINPIIEALRKRQDEIKFIGARHGEAAAFMVTGYVKHFALDPCNGSRPTHHHGERS